MKKKKIQSGELACTSEEILDRGEIFLRNLGKGKSIIEVEDGERMRKGEK